MVRNCGIGIAVENGIDEIKNIAKEICGTNENDGVARWIEKNIL
jgi:hydroxymethylpyrimidine pyrophosphatase-like HAD family hydrolase